MKAVILAAGYATRLYPLTIDKPKALLKVMDRHILEYLLENVQEIPEINEAIIVTNDKFYNHFKDYIKNNYFKSLPSLKVINDGTDSNETRLGGLGDLEFAIQNEKISDDILVLNSDNLFDFSLKPAFDFFKEKKSVVNGVYAVESFKEAKRHGVVEIKKGKIISFEEKPKKPRTLMTSIGVYFFPKFFLPEIEKYLGLGYSRDSPGNLIKYFVEKKEVHAFLFKGKLLDIGSLENYRNADSFFRKI